MSLFNRLIPTLFCVLSVISLPTLQGETEVECENYSNLQFLVENRAMTYEELAHSYVKYRASLADNRYSFLADPSLSTDNILDHLEKYLLDYPESLSSCDPENNSDLNFLVENRPASYEELVLAFIKYRSGFADNKFSFLNDNNISFEDKLKIASEEFKCGNLSKEQVWSLIVSCHDKLCRETYDAEKSAKRIFDPYVRTACYNSVHTFLAGICIGKPQQAAAAACAEFIASITLHYLYYNEDSYAEDCKKRMAFAAQLASTLDNLCDTFNKMP